MTCPRELFFIQIVSGGWSLRLPTWALDPEHVLWDNSARGHLIWRKPTYGLTLLSTRTSWVKLGCVSSGNISDSGLNISWAFSILPYTYGPCSIGPGTNSSENNFFMQFLWIEVDSQCAEEWEDESTVLICSLFFDIWINKVFFCWFLNCSLKIWTTYFSPVSF